MSNEKMILNFENCDQSIVAILQATASESGGEVDNIFLAKVLSEGCRSLLSKNSIDLKLDEILEFVREL
jgi:hypothetical protein